MNVLKVNEAIVKIKPGLDKYLSIMEKFNKVDVSKDKSFQRAFNGFYRIRQRESRFYEKYYLFMEANKTKEPSFEKTLLYLYNEFGTVEASFSSKLIATINPDLPIWDSIVLKNLNLKKPSYYSTNRIKETVELYNKIVQWYRYFIDTELGRDIIEIFDKNYPEAKITNIKKIDFVLWQIRE